MRVLEREMVRVWKKSRCEGKQTNIYKKIAKNNNEIKTYVVAYSQSWSSKCRSSGTLLESLKPNQQSAL